MQKKKQKKLSSLAEGCRMLVETQIIIGKQ